MVLVGQILYILDIPTVDILTNYFTTMYQKLDCIFHECGFVIHQSFKIVTANHVGYLESKVLNDQNGFGSLMIGTIQHERLGRPENCASQSRMHGVFFFSKS